MTDVDERISASERHVRDAEDALRRLGETARYRPNMIDDKDVQLAERLLTGWRSFRVALGRDPELRERERERALLNATGRLQYK